jgi:hypothetical protein
VLAYRNEVFEKYSNSSVRHGSLETGEILTELAFQGREFAAGVREDSLPQFLEFRDMAFRHSGS